MELKIYFPTEEGFIKAIEWNHEEIKKEVAEKVKHYASLVYTDEQIKIAKTDRATLNKFIQAMENKRKEVKKQCLAPYEEFEKKMKEIITIVNEPVALIDKQIKDYESNERTKKLIAIEEIWERLNAHEWLILGRILDDKWLNASVKLPAIEKEIIAKLEQIKSDLITLQNLPEFSFEAIELYKKTLNINTAIEEARLHSEIAKAKAEFEAEQKCEEAPAPMPETIPDANETAKAKEISFRCWLTVEDAKALKQFFNSRNIKYEAIR